MKNFEPKEQNASKYLALYEKLRRDIVSGSYAFGMKLPSKRSLAEKETVSVITAEHAYALLAEEGYIESRERSGYFVIFREEDAFSPTRLLPAQTPVRLKAEALPPESFPFSVYARAVRRVLTGFGAQIFSKAPGQGCTELREALAAYLRRSRGIEVAAEQIVIGAGAEYLYGLAIQLLGRDRGYAAEYPSYAQIQKIYQANGIAVELLPLGAEGIESAALNQCRAQVLHITPYRSFPSGVTASAAKKREYLRFAAKRQGFIIEDDCESEFRTAAKPAETVFALDDGGRTVYINTFSRTIAPAIRIGYMLLPQQLLPIFDSKLGFYSCTVPTLDQLVLAELLANGDFERHIDRIRRRRRREKTNG